MFNNEEAAYALEEEIVNEEFLKRSDVYNMVIGGEGGILKQNQVKVHRYDLKGNYIETFTSITDAAEVFKVHHSAIGHAVRKKQKACESYWNTDKVDKLDLTNYNKGDNHKIPVYMYDIEGNYLQCFESQAEAKRQLGFVVTTRALYLGTPIRKKYYFCTTFGTSFDKARTEYVKNRPVYRYEADGNFNKEYATQLEAEKENPNSNISKSIKTKTPDKNGYIWGLVKLDNYNTPHKQNAKRKVGKYTLENELVQVYESATKAANENGTSVWKVLAGTNKTHKGHIYKYLEDPVKEIV